MSSDLSYDELVCFIFPMTTVSEDGTNSVHTEYLHDFLSLSLAISVSIVIILLVIVLVILVVHLGIKKRRRKNWELSGRSCDNGIIRYMTSYV